MKLVNIIIVAFSLCTFSVAEDYFKNYTIYFLGVIKHFEPTDLTHEGNMEYLAISKSIETTSLILEGGAGTYKDSYNARSYMVFANISNDKYRYGFFQPILGAQIHYKGVNYFSDDRKVTIFPTLKLRIGKDEGLFVDIMPVPKIGDLTNGFISAEFGYKF